MKTYEHTPKIFKKTVKNQQKTQTIRRLGCMIRSAGCQQSSYIPSKPFCFCSLNKLFKRPHKPPSYSKLVQKKFVNRSNAKTGPEKLFWTKTFSGHFFFIFFWTSFSVTSVQNFFSGPVLALLRFIFFFF